MTRILRGLVAAGVFAALAACTTAPAQQTDLTPPAKRLDAKTMLECGKKC